MAIDKEMDQKMELVDVLTEGQKKAYVESDGTLCPFCNGDQIEGRELESGDGVATQAMYCKACEETWFDVYRLVDVESFRWKEKPDTEKDFVKEVSPFPAPVQKPFGFAQDKLLTPEQFEKFLTLATALSPENLSCDGELPQAEIRKKVKDLMRQWVAVEQEVGRKVTEGEVWDRVLKEEWP